MKITIWGLGFWVTKFSYDVRISWHGRLSLKAFTACNRLVRQIRSSLNLLFNSHDPDASASVNKLSWLREF